MPTLTDRLSSFHRNERGAIALLVLAGMLVVLMMALVIFDAGEAGRDKVAVQAAADTAAWSEAAVEARAMNMIAFANVAKRVTIGMTAFYDALWASYVELLAATVALAALCWLADIPALGALTPICEEITRFGVAVFTIMAQEAPDGAIFLASLNNGFFKDDVVALDNYQTYMTKLAPWWAYAEGIQRGIRNGAAITASYPVPPNSFTTSNLGISLPGLQLRTTGDVDKLPIERTPADDAIIQTCIRIYSNFDFALHEADYLLKSATHMTENAPYNAIAYGLTAILALANLAVTCPVQMAVWGEPARPWKIKDYSGVSGSAKWLTETSNLTFAYLPNKERMHRARDRYKFISKDFDYATPVIGELIYRSGGYWAIARSEISFQNGTPNLWHPSWTARMRPVAIPGEWTNNSPKFGSAFIDVLPVMIAGAGLSELTSGDIDLDGALPELTRILLATQAYTDPNLEGMSK